MENRKKTFLKDYSAPSFAVDQVHLEFQILDDRCQVRACVDYRRLDPKITDLFLNGDKLKLLSIKLNNEVPKFEASEEGVLIRKVPEHFTLLTEVELDPFNNTELEGLYASDGCLVTQCEAQGFRKITYFLDRPDVMSSYTVSIQGDPKKYPVMLSNGDRIREEILPDGQRRVTWRDPHKKPCYLFALVAGDLGKIEEKFITQSEREVTLEIYSAHGTQHKCKHAMESLKKCMRWDEIRYGREYDLDTYMVVAIDSFNSGAMENKGLNIFNSRLVLVDPKSATDMDFFLVESVVAHEYFHNWTGNRVTLRDWFELSLKEGLTVFRDQEFSMDMFSRDVVRIDSVKHLRNTQFSEDAGPNSHPVRPESCYSVENFFTATIYEKGAEVIRMMQTLVGRPGFRKGMDLYFSRHDGQAVSIDDFAAAISSANDQNWEQFKLWYSQAGTPHLLVREKYNDGKYTLSLEQKLREGQNAFHIPLLFGLLNTKGQEIPIDWPRNTEGNTLLQVRKMHEEFEIACKEKPVLSLNRQFSAPVKFDWNRPSSDLIHLLRYDPDGFNRYEASQKLFLDWMVATYLALEKGQRPTNQPEIIKAIEHVLLDPSIDNATKALLLALPDDAYFVQFLENYLGTQLINTRQFIKNEIAQSLSSLLKSIHASLFGKFNQSIEPKAMGSRSLQNSCLDYLCTLPEFEHLALEQFERASIMTDEIAALHVLTEVPKYRDVAIEKFYSKWKDDSLVLNKWFSMQAASQAEDTLERVQSLFHHPDFQITNPNRVYSLLRTFGNNLGRFHDGAGMGYKFMADKILEIEKINSRVATRLASSFDSVMGVAPELRQKAKAQIERMHRAGLSVNTFEIIDNQMKQLNR